MAISDKIASIQNHLKDDWNSVESLIGDTDLDKNIENISAALDDLYNDLPKVTGSGTDITLDDTRKGRLESTLNGNTSQDGTPTPTSPIPVNVVSGGNEINVCGKNLFSLKNISNGTTLGIERTINNSILTINGTSTGSGQVMSRQTTGIVLPSGTYNLSIRRSSGTITANSKAMAFYLRTPSSTEIKTVSIQYFATSTYYFTSSFTLTESTELYVEIYCNGAGLVADNLMLQFQIEKGNQTTTYEPYIGNTYNIDLPVENLFDKNTITENQRLDPSGNNNYDENCDLSDYIKIQPNTTYTRNITASVYECICFYTIDKTFISRDTTHSTTTSPNNAYYVRISCYKTNLDTLQFEIGSKVNSFTPYGQTPIELCKIGTYQDYFYKDSDKWYLYKEIGKVASYNGETITTSYISTTGGLNTGATVYYVLATPTTTEITDTTLISQLNALEQAQSKENQTNISQVNNDLPFIISASALKEWSE